MPRLQTDAINRCVPQLKSCCHQRFLCAKQLRANGVMIPSGLWCAWVPEKSAGIMRVPDDQLIKSMLTVGAGLPHTTMPVS